MFISVHLTHTKDGNEKITEDCND